MPSGRCFPLALGIYTRRAGKGSHDDVVRSVSRAIAILAGPSRATTLSTPAVRRPALRWVTRRALTRTLDHDLSMSFWRFLAFARSPFLAAAKILCRSRATLRSRAPQSVRSHSLAPSGPFTVAGI